MLLGVKASYQAHAQGHAAIALLAKWLALTVRLALAAVFILTLPDAQLATLVRTLSLLDPETALALVTRECDRYIARIRDGIERLVRIHRVTSSGGDDGSFARYTFHTRSNLPASLNGWTTQLEEFAHKGIARKGTLAVTAIVRAMATIGRNYACARRGSIFLVPDFSGGMPIGISDIGNVLNPIYESIKRICQDAAKQSNEAVVQGCMIAQGDMAAHAMTMVHTSDRRRTAPLAFSSVYYIEVCTKAAISANMDDALLAAIEVTREVFTRISAETYTHEGEEKAFDGLFDIAATSYPRQALVPCYKSVEMMLHAVRHDIRLRGYQEATSLLGTVLPNLAALMPYEAAMDTGGQRILQPFSPYSLGFEANLPTLLAEVANQVKPVDPKRSWIDPFHEFERASEAILMHFRQGGGNHQIEGGLLEKWVVDSLLNAAGVHLQLIDHPPSGSERFLGTVSKRLSWFLHAPAFLFQEKTQYPYPQAEDACAHLAVLGIGLLQRARHEEAGACGDTIRSIARAESPRSYTRELGFADCAVKLELLARAADAFG